MLKTRTWIALVCAAALISGVLSLRLLTGRREGTVVEVMQDGAVIREIDLSRVSAEYAFTVTCPDGGENTILVQPGRICVSAADCPDQVCVRQGWLSNQTTPVICLPHRLILRVQGVSDGVDGVSK